MSRGSAVRKIAINSTRKKVNATRKYSKGKLIRLPVEKIRSKKPSEAKIQDLIVTHRAQAQKLAISMLKKWRSRLDKNEVISIVDLSICEAARRFNPSKGAAFMTFMFYHLRGNLIRAVSEAANYNLVPLFEREMGDTATHAKASSNPIANAIEVAELLNHREQDLPDDSFYRKEIAKLGIRACEKLDSLEQQIVFRVILDEEQILDVAKSLGYSRCHLSRVKRKALATLEKELKCVVNESSSQENLSLRKKQITRRGEGRRETLAQEDNNEIFEIAANC